MAPRRRRLHVACAAAANGGARDSKLALITGGNTGIGFETAKALLQQGYRVILGCRDKERAEAARAKLTCAGCRHPAPAASRPAAPAATQYIADAGC